MSSDQALHDFSEITLAFAIVIGCGIALTIRSRKSRCGDPVGAESQNNETRGSNRILRRQRNQCYRQDGKNGFLTLDPQE